MLLFFYNKEQNFSIVSTNFLGYLKEFYKEVQQKAHKTITDPFLSIETIVGYFDGETQLGLCGGGMVTY